MDISKLVTLPSGNAILDDIRQSLLDAKKFDAQAQAEWMSALYDFRVATDSADSCVTKCLSLAKRAGVENYPLKPVVSLTRPGRSGKKSGSTLLATVDMAELQAQLEAESPKEESTEPTPAKE